MGRTNVIYGIRHNPTGNFYVGRTTDPERRFRDHINRLRRGQHDVEDMQRDFDQHGEDYNVFRLDTETALSEGKERWWIEELGSHIRGNGYNYNDPRYSNKLPGHGRVKI